MTNKPLVLCIMDGVGINNDTLHNAVAMADMPFFQSLLGKYPHSVLDASGTAVGLPDGTMGNSEVGHITIGAGRVVNQFLRRFQMENWDKNEPLRNFINTVKKNNGIVHVAGLMSDGRVHSDIEEILVIAKKILNDGLKLCIHFIADGRDTLPQSAPEYIKLIKKDLREFLDSGQAFFGTLSGRYYAMDRNKNLDRTNLAFNAIAMAKSEYSARNIDDALQDAYNRGETDEFIKPVVIDGDMPLTKNDGFLFANYRSDRARQIVRAILETGAYMLCFSQYGEGLNEACPALLTDGPVINTLGEVLAKNNLRQLRIAETEKYAHVTFFFNGGVETPNALEDRVLIPSPQVATYDLQPEMSAYEVTDKLLTLLDEDKYDVVILNFANPDMVGHTGVMDAAVKAMEAVDTCAGKIVKKVLALGGAVCITADHGNLEKMYDGETNQPYTAHTTNPVPFLMVSADRPKLHEGILADIAPTLLELLGIAQPAEMTGHSLIEK